ncbi:hypothetical protein [Sphingobacterium sp. 1.A.5]|uniref:hypothetical protein n=1 Tax=Sphingobacterium sp. 1.A.5 TaxID=2044604 RepID=UPI000C0BCF5B|nr:hypothetical protein [Sphingobacterium sp. 1.A.5]
MDIVEKYKQLKMSLNEVTRKMVVRDLSIQVNQKIEEIFKGYSNIFKEKAKFLVWIINREKSYQLHFDNHKHFFGLSGKKGYSLTDMLNKLIQNNIIKQVNEAVIGATSNEYSTTDQYKWKKKTGEEKEYYNDTRTLPKFIKRFMVDWYVVKKKELSEYDDDLNFVIELDSESKPDISIDDYQKTIDELKSQLNIQKQINEKLQNKINELENTNSSAESPIEVTQSIIEEPFPMDEELDFSERSTAYDSEIENYISKNNVDANDIYQKIKTKKIDKVPMPIAIKETQYKALWLAIQFKIKCRNKVA